MSVGESVRVKGRAMKGENSVKIDNNSNSF